MSLPLTSPRHDLLLSSCLSQPQRDELQLELDLKSEPRLEVRFQASPPQPCSLPALQLSLAPHHAQFSSSVNQPLCENIRPHLRAMFPAKSDGAGNRDSAASLLMELERVICVHENTAAVHVQPGPYSPTGPR